MSIELGLCWPKSASSPNSPRPRSGPLLSQWLNIAQSWRLMMIPCKCLAALPINMSTAHVRHATNKEVPSRVVRARPERLGTSKARLPRRAGAASILGLCSTDSGPRARRAGSLSNQAASVRRACVCAGLYKSRAKAAAKDLHEAGQRSLPQTCRSASPDCCLACSVCVRRIYPEFGGQKPVEITLKLVDAGLNLTNN